MDYQVTFHTSFVVTGDDDDQAEQEAADCFESVFGIFPNLDNWSATVEAMPNV